MYFHYQFDQTVYMVSFVFALFNIIARWKLFNKAGRLGIGSIIPIYSDIALCRIVHFSPLWLLCFLIPFVNVIFAVFYHIIISFRLAKYYGKGTLFGLGLLCLNPLFIMILGFGNSRYEG